MEEGRIRILVTGGTGFIGSHLCERLAREGYAVRALVRNRTRSADLLDWGVEVAMGDLRDPKSLEQAMDGIDVVYHLAALFHPENVTRKQFWETNVQGTRNMLDAALKTGIRRFIHCSSTGVHVNTQNPPVNEETPYSPITGDHYQASKIQAEQVVLEYMARGRVPTVIFRTTGVYGPRDLKFLKLFKAIKNRRFVMVGSGEVLYHMIYIDDLIDGILLCGTRENALGRAYILVSEEAMTLNQHVRLIAGVLGVSPPRLRLPFTPVYLAGLLCELICKPFGINPPLYRRRVNFFRTTRRFDMSKAKRELGFRPKVDLKTGIGLTIEWYQEEGLL
jgi:nucleoside-diphosphate-sugar epimerase